MGKSNGSVSGQRRSRCRIRRSGANCSEFYPTVPNCPLVSPAVPKPNPSRIRQVLCLHPAYVYAVERFYLDT